MKLLKMQKLNFLHIGQFLSKKIYFWDIGYTYEILTLTSCLLFFMLISIIRATQNTNMEIYTFFKETSLEFDFFWRIVFIFNSRRWLMYWKKLMETLKIIIFVNNITILVVTILIYYYLHKVLSIYVLLLLFKIHAVSQLRNIQKNWNSVTDS